MIRRLAPGTAALAPTAPPRTAFAPAVLGAPTAAAFALIMLAPLAVAGQSPVSVPWAAGEFLEYEVKVGIMGVGSARMEVLPSDTIRGHTAWRLRFNVTGGFWPIRVNDSYDSWMDVETLNSLRFIQDLDEAGHRRYRDFAIYPERAMYQQKGKDETKSVSEPLDDASFFYFVRSIPLEVGKEYEIPRYFDPTKNPVIIKVLRKESVRVRAGRFDAIVIQPIIKTSGLFSEGGEAELWFSDDNRRILLQMKTKIQGVTSLNLYLRTMRLTQDAVKPAAPHP